MAFTNPHDSNPAWTWFVLFLLLMSLIPAPAIAGADSSLFPVFKSINPNITFWEKIYSTYSINTAVIHDQNNLSRIYTTVSLLDKSIPGAQKQNKKRTQKAKKHYQKLLTGLAKKKQSGKC